MTLPPRLAAVASFVPPCNTLADIGTDHAYIPIHLVQNGIAKSAVASDVAIGPTKIAGNHIRQYGLTDKIEVVVGNGLEKIRNADVIVIAGMGGKVICDIIEGGMCVSRNAKSLILQPMTMVEEVRRFLHKKDFTIYDETIAKEDEKLYNIIAVKSGAQNIQDDMHYYIGRALIEKHDDLLGEYILKKVNSLDVAINNMGNSDIEVNNRTEFIRLKERFLEVYNDYCS